MKIRRVIISAVLAGFAMFGSAAPAQAGLWCDQSRHIEPVLPDGTGGSAGVVDDTCRAAASALCDVVRRLGGSGGCLG